LCNNLLKMSAVEEENFKADLYKWRTKCAQFIKNSLEIIV
jgi:hypothetical protein